MNTRDLPGDIQIDIAIQKLGYGSPCGEKLLRKKLERLATQAEPPKKIKRG